MLVAESRPRSLKWYHAGPLLFGDWGTSRLYVLGLAFYYTAHASIYYLAAMSFIMIGVAWAYTVVCRSFPDGGGAYTSARQLSPLLSVIGATLLLCDYIVTASLSCVEAFHYLGVAERLVVPLCLVTFIAVGVVNWLGARSAGRVALVIAIAAIIASALIAILCIPYLGKGVASTTTHFIENQSPFEKWESLVRIVLALSGVEAVANMTGLMQQPVKKTSKRTIWPVLAEVVLLNMIFGIALNALPQVLDVKVPHYVQYELGQNTDGPNGEPIKYRPEDVPAEVKDYRDTAMKVLAIHVGQEAFGKAVGLYFGLATAGVFALLLLSAVNTATMAMVAVMYSLAQDRELPRALTRLNYSGVPWMGLVIAVAGPSVLLLFEADVKALGELYAIGVVGAITINFLACAANRKLELGKYERMGLWGLGGLMAVVELTIIVAKPNATLFAGSIIASVLVMRWFVRARAAAKAAEPLPAPEQGWLAELSAPAAKVGAGPRIMLAARGRDQAEFAVDLARQRKATLFVIYVRTLRLIDVVPGQVPKVDEDPQAQEALGTALVVARNAGAPCVPIYVTSSEITAEILDYTATYGCDTLILGKSRRGMFSRRLEGDIVAQVAQQLPPGVQLITRAPGPFGEVSVEKTT
jgi:amino acid transporter/nucleotide-binding universal stress UspA family protein